MHAQHVGGEGFFPQQGWCRELRLFRFMPKPFAVGCKNSKLEPQRPHLLRTLRTHAKQHVLEDQYLQGS